MERLVKDGVGVVDDERLKTIIGFALNVNVDAKGITDQDGDALRSIGLSDKGIGQ